MHGLWHGHSTCMYHGHSTCIMSYMAHGPSPLRQGSWGANPPIGGRYIIVPVVNSLFFVKNILKSLFRYWKGVNRLLSELSTCIACACPSHQLPSYETVQVYYVHTCRNWNTPSVVWTGQDTGHNNYSFSVKWLAFTRIDFACRSLNLGWGELRASV